MSRSITRASTEVSSTPATDTDVSSTRAAGVWPEAVFRVWLKSCGFSRTPSRSASARLSVTALAPVSTSIRIGRPSTVASAQ